MTRLLNELIGVYPVPNYLHPFAGLSVHDERSDVEARILALKEVGVRSMNLLWHGGDETGGFTPFNSDAYWTRIGWVAEICRREGMTFMMQDAAPFPTGLADGSLMRPENLGKNKLYLGERHLDVQGPNPEGAFLVSELMGSIRCTDQEHGFGAARPFPGDSLYAVVAVRRNEDGLDGENAVDLTDSVEDGLLLWPVPEGIWRIFVIFETMNDGGRRYYINLLNAESVRLNIDAIYQPHYEHLRNYAGKEWIGFFYDEAEIGNLLRYCTPTLPGARRNVEGESMALPWSVAARQVWKTQEGEDARRLLPFLWEQNEVGFRAVRVRYMDMISRILKETFNGQMHAWCREHGLGYIGHNLEDENTHCGIATGPVHFFRMQAHQDAGGVDLIGGQLMPGKDFKQAWYGNPDGDGEFYHYGIAKLASSAGHIMPNKRGRSFCEVFAVYGDIAGTRLRKFVYDHLLVNGINEMIPAPPFIPGGDSATCRRENDYVNRLCHWMHKTRAVVKAAVLYHAQAEWFGGDFNRFQAVGGALAQHQISYDVLPEDVFEDAEFFQADFSSSLSVNGNAYDALIIPRAEALPRAVAAWLEKKAAKVPVIFCDNRPALVAETGETFDCAAGEVVPMARLAEALEAIVRRDIRLDRPLPTVRYSHYAGEDGDWYFLVNQGEACRFEASFHGDGELYALDIARGRVERLDARKAGGFLTARLSLARFESMLLLATKEAIDAPTRSEYVEAPLNASWRVMLEDGAIFTMDELKNINARELYPRYVGKVIYETEVDWKETPACLNLGEVFEIADVYVNGKTAGRRQVPPYVFDIGALAVPGNNRLRIEVRTGCVRDLNRGDSAAFGRSMSATVYNCLEPSGMLGPVKIQYRR